jgi:hypothetical protein
MEAPSVTFCAFKMCRELLNAHFKIWQELLYFIMKTPRAKPPAFMMPIKQLPPYYE